MKELVLACLLSSATPAMAASPVLADANNVVLGFFLGETDAVLPEQVQVVSSKGFTATYVRQTGQLTSTIRDPWGNSEAAVAERYFPTSDCTGPSYVEGPAGFTGGGVARVGNTSQLVYVEKNSPMVAFTNASRLTSAGVCEAGNFFPGPFVEAKPNDPSVTGIRNEAAAPPVKIEVANVEGSSFDLFADGFEDASAAVPAPFRLSSDRRNAARLTRLATVV